MNRSDILYLIIGRNPMPNLVSIATRIKDNGEVVCFYTKETEDVFKMLEETVVNKAQKNNINIYIKGLLITDEDNILKVKRQLEDKIDIDADEISTVELNFTGGTKVLSSMAFQVMKEKFREIPGTGILSYFDGENEKASFFIIKKGRQEIVKEVLYSDLEDILKISAEDIISIHNKGNVNLTEPKVKNKELVHRIYNEVMSCRENAVEFPNMLYEEINKRNKSSKLKDEQFDDFIKVMISDKRWNYFKEEKDFYNDKSYYDMSNEEKKKYLKLFKGFWLEEYIAEILLELKEENVIQEVFTSIERKKKGNSKAEFEVDFLVYNNFSIKCISVTTLEKYEEAKFKLYEVKLRASQLAGDEARIVYMNLCENSEKLKSDYKNTWQNDLKDTLIISYDNIAEFKEIIKEWLKGGVR